MTHTLRRDWFKSTRSMADSHCLEAAFGADGDVSVRDSKNPEGGVLSFESPAWTAFLAGVKSGDFSRQ
jgi:hypothetical protein